MFGTDSLAPRQELRLRVRRRLAIAGATAGVLLLPLSNAGATGTEVVPAGSGMTVPAGIAVTPDGAIWVADAELGLCRVDTTGPKPVLVASDWCAPEPVADTLKRGPATIGQIAFDPVTSNFYAAEGDSGSSGVWRMHWNGSAIANDPMLSTKIHNSGGDRVFGLALAPDGSVDFTSKDTTLVRRILAPATEMRSVVSVGNATATAVASLAHLGETIYLAEPTGVTRIAAPASGERAVPVPGLEGTPGALAADSDPARQRLYVGSAGTTGTDRVDVLTGPGDVVSAYDAGYAFISALFVTDDGDVLVADDPPTSAGHPTSVGQSRLFRVSLGATDRPVTTITAGPPAATQSRDAAFAFTSRPGTVFECRFAPVAATPVPAPTACPGDPGQASYVGLADGSYSFEARAADGTVTGRWTRRTFVVDNVAPTVRIDNPPARVVGSTATFDFSADEAGVSYSCSRDGRDPMPCAPPRTVRYLTPGTHTFSVTATDLAGNVSQPDTVSFLVVEPPPPPVQPPAPEAGDDTPATPAALVLVSGSSITCKGMRPARADSFVLRGRTLVTRLTAPAGARYARITLRSLTARSATPRVRAKGFVRTLATRTVRPNGRARIVNIRLSAADRRRLASERFVLRSSYGSCKTGHTRSREMVVRGAGARTS